MKKIYGILLAILMFGGCASDIDMDSMSAEELYDMAYENLGATKYAKAAEMFEKVETDHPYSRWAVKSKLMGAFAHYKDEKYDEAIMAVDRFIKYHPGNKDVPYALYLKGMCYYDQISSADKDQGDTALAAETFARLIVMFPDSKYAKDAAGKMNLTEDYKAGQEMIIGRYYLNEGNYLSALNRFNVILEEYQTTIQIEEALYREVEIYAILGLNNYANGYYNILKNNYPEGKWTAKASKIMEKIGTGKQAPQTDLIDTKAETATEIEEDKAKKKGWFGGWFGSSDDEDVKAVKEDAEKAETTKEETAAAAELEEAAEENSWFGGWFGSSANEDAEPVTEVIEEVEVIKEDAPKEVEQETAEKKSWFSGWFGSSANEDAEPVTEVIEEVEVIKEDAPKEVEQETAEKKSWFSGLFSGGTLMDSAEGSE